MKTLKITLLITLIITSFSCDKEDENSNGNYTLTITNSNTTTAMSISSNTFSPQYVSAYTEITAKVPDDGYVTLSFYNDADADDFSIVTAFDAVANGEYAWSPYSMQGVETIYEPNSGNNGNGAPDCNANPYTPLGIDYQWEAHCQAAYVYWCAGETNALEVQCDTYKDLASQLNLPDCPYCD